jgi:hypothetical protein
VRSAGLPDAALRPMRSNRLVERGVTLHYPTVLLFRHRQLLETMLPGYVSPVVFESFVRWRLGELPG